MRLWADDNDGKFPWKVDQSLGGGKPNGTDNAAVNFQLSLASNELASTKILLCPSDVRRVSATNFATVSLTNVGYALCNEADEKRPRVILATDRNMSGFDFTGLPGQHQLFRSYRRPIPRRAPPNGEKVFAMAQMQGWLC